MQTSIEQLGQILYAPTQYVIPVFQRNYRWKKAQWQQLWESLREIQKPDKTGNHFMGFLVFVPGTPQPGQNTQFYLIDGQQRLTSLSLLLMAIRNVARQLNQGELAQEIHEDYLVHHRKKQEHHYRILPKAHDQTSYLALVDGKNVPEGTMAEALTWFEQQAKLVAEQDPNELRELFNAICQRLDFMCATLEAENAYSIFKSLNSTGVELAASDLIRNFMFMHVTPDEQETFDCEYWAPIEDLFTDATGQLNERSLSAFFRDMLMMNGRYVSPNDIFATFESRHEASGFAPHELAEDIQVCVRHHQSISGQTDDTDTAVTAALRDLNRLDSSTTYPLLLALFRQRDTDAIDSQALGHCIQMLRGFILRRFICGENARGYGQLFVRAIANCADEPIASLETYLLERDWPDDRRFVDAFVSFPLYKRGYAREVLETLERSRGHKEQASLGAAQIEHIMPQTLTSEWQKLLGDSADDSHVEWLHQPGNLTLSAYNQELSNQSFNKKRGRFTDSNVVLTRELAGAATWGPEAIHQRGEQLGKEAAALWLGPETPYQPQQGVRGGAGNPERTRRLRLSFWEGLHNHLKATYPEILALKPTDLERTHSGGIAFTPQSGRTVRLPIGAPYLRLELRYLIQSQRATIDLYFDNEKSYPIWDELVQNHAEVDTMIGDTWFLDGTESGKLRWMTIQHAFDPANESEWPTVFEWLADRLNAAYEQVIPHLREQIHGLYPDKKTVPDSPGSVSPVKDQQRRFWEQLAQAIAAQDSPLNPPKSRPQHWMNYAIGRSGFQLTAAVNSRDDRIAVGLEIQSEDSKQQFRRLLSDRDDIEAKLGFSLEWQEKPDKVMSRISLRQYETPPGDESRWPEYVDWLAEHMRLMDQVFRPLVRQLP